MTDIYVEYEVRLEGDIIISPPSPTDISTKERDIASKK